MLTFVTVQHIRSGLLRYYKTGGEVERDDALVSGVPPSPLHNINKTDGEVERADASVSGVSPIPLQNIYSTFAE